MGHEFLPPLLFEKEERQGLNNKSNREKLLELTKAQEASNQGWVTHDWLEFDWSGFFMILFPLGFSTLKILLDSANRGDYRPVGSS